MFPFGDTTDDAFYDTYVKYFSCSITDNEFIQSQCTNISFKSLKMKVASDAAEALSARFGTRFDPGNWLEILCKLIYTSRMLHVS